MPSAKLYPGICDFHVHVGERIGGYRLRDDFRALDKTAAAHGIAAVGAFVTEEPDHSVSEKLYHMKESAAQHFRGQVFWHLTPIYSTMEDIAPLLGKNCDLKLYTTYKQADIYSSYESIGRWMQDLTHTKTRILVHCEDNDIVERHSAQTSFREPFQHTLRRPEIAEVKAVERVLDMAVKHNHPVHIVHVSTPQAALLIREAKTHNPRISCETAPHYLLHNEDILKGENAHRWLCSPPFRSEHSRGLLVELLQDGYFDILASDHCPFTDLDKDRFKDTPEKVPCGIPGLATLFSSVYHGLVVKGTISLDQMIRFCCSEPAKLMGIDVKAMFTMNNIIGKHEEGK